MPRHGEGLAVAGEHRLKDPVAHGEAVVEHGDVRRIRLDHPPIDPGLHPSSSAVALASPTSRAALSSVSSHSASASEPQVMPAPVPNLSMPSATSNVRIATARSAVRASASTPPNAPQYAPRGAASSSRISRRALDLGAPVTEPGGKVASSSSG